jgi:hypothetical protein
MSWKHMKRAGVGLSVAAALGLTVAVADAAVGDVLATVAIPAGALCEEDSGTAVAIVPGGKAGFPAIPVLLVTSCRDKLFLIDPASPAAPVRTLTTSINPAGGWTALSARADTGDLLACAAPNVLYSIDFSTLNTVADGTATLLRSGPEGSTCAGIAWDSADKTIYQTGVTGGANVVFKFGDSASSSATSVPAGCPAGLEVRGIAVAGTSLFVSCASLFAEEVFTAEEYTEGDEIRQANKADGGPSAPAPRNIPVTAPAQLAYDPVTAGSQFKDAIWTRSPAELRALEIPGGTSGQVRGAPVLFPAACPAGYPTTEGGHPLDTDNDGLLDCWEDGTLWSDGLPGISFSGAWNGYPYPTDSTHRDVTLCVEANGLAGFQPAECARVDGKDTFVEIDYMQFHRPDPVAIAGVVSAFAGAPSPDAAHPTHPGPIRLHVQIDEEIPHVNATALPPCTPAPAAGEASFDVLKAQSFGTAAERARADGINAKSFAFRYALFVHNQSGGGNTASGCAEVGGNDFMVSLGGWGVVIQADGTTHNAGTTDQQAGTFMHELGHTLGLRHGGGDNTNCKPNYQSVMNYSLQMGNVLTGRPLDYSRGTLATLDEARLVETAGVGALPGDLVLGKVVFGPQSGVPSKPQLVTANADGSIDWSRSGGVSATPLARDLNNLAIAGCPAAAGTFPANAQALQGFDDWASIALNFRASVDFAGGASSTIEEKKEDGTLAITLAEALSLSRDTIDIKPSDPNNIVNRNSDQTIEVAMLGRRDDQGLLEFDARNLDPATMFLRGTGGPSGPRLSSSDEDDDGGGASRPPARERSTWAVPVKRNPQGTFLCSARDVNRDRVLDLVCQFELAKNTLAVGETTAVLEATTLDGVYNFHGSDAITAKP